MLTNFYMPLRKKLITLSIMTALLLLTAFATPMLVHAGTLCGAKGQGQTQTTIDIGCTGKGNSITDASFGIIRFLSNGVGVVLVASMVYAGIQYTSSKGDPNGTNQAINRIRANVFALMLYIFSYALLNYIIPGQVLHG